MPQCHRCGRENMPRCEVRKTPLGYVCKDNGKGSRCAVRAVELRAERHRGMRLAI